MARLERNEPTRPRAPRARDRRFAPAVALLAVASLGLPGCSCQPAGAGAGAASPPADPAPEPGRTPPTPPVPEPGGAGGGGADPGAGWVGILFRNEGALERTPGGEPPAEAEPGIEILNVAIDSPASGVGIRVGDRVVALNGKAVKDAARLEDALKYFPPGSRIRIGIQRGDDRLDVDLEIGSFDIRARARQALEKGVAFLLASQKQSGSWPHFQSAEGSDSAATSALALRALCGLPPDLREKSLPAIDRAIGWLSTMQTEEGAIVQDASTIHYRNYTTAFFLSSLAALGRAEDAELLAKTAAGLTARQLDDDKGITEYEFVVYGAWNYHDEDIRASMRGDVSITSCVLEALYRAKLSEDDPCYEPARLFLARTQNYKKGAPPQVKAIFDGGFSFNPRDSKAGSDVLRNGIVRFRSYGSCTSDGLRASIYAHVPRDAEPIAEAIAWLGKNFETRRNPGFEPDDPIRNAYGIYYYYLNSLTDALHAAGVKELVGRSGRPIDWRTEVASALIYRQREDGSWRNEVNTMSEDDPVLGTSFAVLSLARCLAEAK